MTASKIFLVKEPELKVFRDPERQLIVVQGSGRVPSGLYREGLQRAANTAVTEKLPNWLVNNRMGGIITIEDQIWTSDVIAPQLASESNLQKMGFIEPEDVLSKIILVDMMDRARDIFPFEMQFFEKLENAFNWFRDTASPLRF